MERTINHVKTPAGTHCAHTHSINISKKHIFKEPELQAVSKLLHFINIENLSFDINFSRNDSDWLAQENLSGLESIESEAVQSVNNESKPSFWSMTNGDMACLEEQIVKTYYLALKLCWTSFEMTSLLYEDY